MKTLLLIALLTLAGCGTLPTSVSKLATSDPDSTRWVMWNEAGNYVSSQTYAYTWRQNKLNLWTRGQFICHPSTPVFDVVDYGVVYGANLPPLWQSGDTIRGTWVTSSPDTFPVVGGRMWAYVQADTMWGQTFTDVNCSCGIVTDTLAFRLVRNLQ